MDDTLTYDANNSSRLLSQYTQISELGSRKEGVFGNNLGYFFVNSAKKSYGVTLI